MYLGKEGTRNYIHVDYKNKCSSLVKIFFSLEVSYMCRSDKRQRWIILKFTKPKITLII